MSKKEFNTLSIVAHMGIPEEIAKRDTEQAFKWGVDAIVGQGNGTDWGPYWLGNEECHTLDRDQVATNMEYFIPQAIEHKVPFVFSLGSPSGTERHLEEALEDIDKFAREKNITFKAAVITGEIDKEFIKEKIRKGEKFPRVIDSPRLPEYLTEEDVDAATKIVAQMGPEPIQKALKMDVDGVLTGRALDVGLHMAPLMNAGFDKGLAAHMAKTIECAGICLEHKSSADPAYATMKEDHFLVTSPDVNARGTVDSVSGHALYERRDPFKEENPGGYLDLTEATHEQIDDRTVKVAGGKWIDVSPYTVKLEGAKFVGYRSASIIGIREPRMLEQLDWVLDDVRKKAESFQTVKDMKPEVDYSLRFRVYGRDGVLGNIEPETFKGHEVGIVIEVTGPTQEFCDDYIQYVYTCIAYGNYPGKRTTSGNIETPYSPHFFALPPEYQYNVWHLMPLDDPCEPFKIEVVEFPRKK